MVKVTVVCEHNASMDSPEGKAAYPLGLGQTLAKLFGDNGYDVSLVINDKDSDGSGLTDELLAQTEVLVWWGHWYHQNIKDEIAEKVVARVHQGMGFLVLHSAHHCKPFKRLMGTTCNLSWREINERERIWVIDEAHPIAQGLDKSFVIPHEEMYGEQFDIPTPDELVFISWFQGGEVMRSGCVWKRAKGKIFFLRCGHETNPTYRQKEVQTVLLNAVKYLTPAKIFEPSSAPKIPVPPEGDIVITDWNK